eukprot:Skav222396  [mRNA]  locus=scaffold4422:212418:213059:+ [translate_table: standard]
MATERQGGGSLVSGELVATVSAQPSWTVNEVTCAVQRAAGRGPGGLAQAVRLFVENQAMEPRRSLEQLGVDKVQVLFVNYLEDQSFQEKLSRMEADLNRLNPDIFDKLRYEPRPSQELLDVLCPIKLLLDHQDDLSWHAIRKMLYDRGLQIRLQEFSIDSVPLETLAKLRDMVAKSNLERDRLGRRSFAAAWLSSWVLVMHQCAVAKLEFYSL